MKEKLCFKRYDNIYEFDDYKIVIVKEKEGLLSADNREILPCVYDEILDIIDNNYVLLYKKVNNEVKYNLFDIKVKTFLFDFIYDDINLLYTSNNEETLIELSINKNLYIYNLTAGKIVLEALEYDIYYGRYIGVKKGDSYTLFDFKGSKLVDSVTNFYSYKYNLLKLHKNNNENFYDHENNEIVFLENEEKTTITEEDNEFIISLSKKKIQIYCIKEKITIIYEGEYKYISSRLKIDNKYASFVKIYNQVTRKYSLISSGNILEENLKDISIYDNVIVCKKDNGYINYYDVDKLLGTSHEFDDLNLEKIKHTNCGVIILDDFKNKKSYLVNTDKGHYIKTDTVKSIEYKSGKFDLIKLENGYNIYDYDKNVLLLDEASPDIKFFIDIFRTHNNEASLDAGKYAFVQIDNLYYCFDLNECKFSAIGYKNYLSVIGKYGVIFKSDEEENNKFKLINVLSGDVIDEYDEINIYYDTFILTKNSGNYSLINLYPYKVILEDCDSILIENGIAKYQKGGQTDTYEIFNSPESEIPLLVKKNPSSNMIVYNDIYFESEEDINFYQRVLKK